MFVNEIKLARAMKTLKDAGNTTPTQEEIRTVYEKFGGLFVEENVTAEPEMEAEEKPKKSKK